MQSKTRSIYQQRQESFDELIHGKKKLLYSADQDNVVSSNKGGISWLTVSHSSIRWNCCGTVNANNEYYFTALLQRAFKTLMLRIPVKRRGEGEGEVGTPNRSHYQCPVLRCDPVFGWNFLLSIPGFPSFLHFETQKYLHVLFISIKKGKCK